MVVMDFPERLKLLFQGSFAQDGGGDLAVGHAVWTDRRRHTPSELFGGQQQRVAIARALIGNPKIFFSAEPTGNLDSKTRDGIMVLLREINQTNGQTIINTFPQSGAKQHG